MCHYSGMQSLLNDPIREEANKSFIPLKTLAQEHKMEVAKFYFVEKEGHKEYSASARRAKLINMNRYIKHSSKSRESNRHQSHRLGEEARMQQLLKQHKLSGGRNSRPLVGGFAAAAYEAMKKDYYSDH